MKVHQAGATVTLQRTRQGRRPYCESCMRFLGLAIRNLQAAMQIAEDHLDRKHPQPKEQSVREIATELGWPYLP